MKINILLILIVFIQYNSFTQSLWNKTSVPLEYSQAMGVDTSLIDLKNIINNKAENLFSFRYVYAV